MVGFINFTQLDAYVVRDACDKHLDNAKQYRDRKFAEAVERNRKTVGWPWNRHIESDDEVIKRCKDYAYSYFDFFEWRYKMESEIDVEKLRNLCDSAIKVSESPAVYVTQQTMQFISKFI